MVGLFTNLWLHPLLLLSASRPWVPHRCSVFLSIHQVYPQWVLATQDEMLLLSFLLSRLLYEGCSLIPPSLLCQRGPGQVPHCICSLCLSVSSLLHPSSPTLLAHCNTPTFRCFNVWFNVWISQTCFCV